MNAAPHTPANGGVFDIVRSYRRRARKARWLAHFYFAFAVVLLGGGVWAVERTADILVNQDVETARSALAPVPERARIHLRSIAADGGGRRFIAVGDKGAILTSDGGRDWKAAESGVREGLRSIAVADGVAVAVGDDGIILRSRDRRSWRTRRSNTPYNFNAVAVSGEVAVAAGGAGLLRVSHDRGRTWKDPDDVVTGKDFNAVAVSGQTAVAAGDDGLLRVSPDGGRTWNSEDVVTKNDFNAVAVRGRTVVAAGGKGLLWVSDNDGKDWTDKSGGLGKEGRRIRFKAVAIRGGAIVAVGSKRRHGVVWRLGVGEAKNGAGTLKVVGDRLEAVALSADGKVAVAAGRGGGILVAADGGKEWPSRDSMTANDFNAVALADDGDTAVAVGDDATISLLESSAEGALFPVETKEESVKAGAAPGNGDAGRSPEDAAAPGPSGDISRLTGAIFLHANAIRAGILLLVMFFMRALFVMIRQLWRLAGFYDARADALLLFGTGLFGTDGPSHPGSDDDPPPPHPGSDDDPPRTRRVRTLTQLMLALSPDHLDTEHTPRTFAERMAAFFGRGAGRANS